ncbi:hypothetical protein BDV10DRAFT_163754 [Aspergillus recurvatus]
MSRRCLRLESRRMANFVDNNSRRRGPGVRTGSCQGRSPWGLWGPGACLVLTVPSIRGSWRAVPGLPVPAAAKLPRVAVLYRAGLQSAARLEHLLQLKPFRRGSQFLRSRFG